MRKISGSTCGSVALGALAVALLSGGAHSQTITPSGPVASATPDTAASEIVVTGTRIKRQGLTSNSPLTVVGEGEIKYQGATSVESVLNKLPQFTAAENENVSNGSDGTSKLNLRNLGSSRVLVLLNGQRMLPQQAVDTNFVPSSLVQRVDVVTGGASAVYGSDALSGVVNFVLRDDLDGFRLDAQTSAYQHSNGDDYLRGLGQAKGYATAPSTVFEGDKVDVNGAFGKNFAGGRGNITVYGGYRQTRPITQDTRDVSACALDPADDAGTNLTCGGSSNNQWGLFTLLTGPNTGQTLNNTKDGQHTWVPYNSSFLYNYSPTNYFQRSDKRATAGAFAKFKFSPLAELYGSFMYMNDHTFSQAAPSALFQGTTFTINCDNPYLSSSQATTLCGPAAGTAQTEDTFIGYRLTTPRRDDLRHEDFRYTLGLRGDFAKGFSYDVSYLRSEVRYDETYLNNVDNVKAQRALNVVNVNGTPTCQSVIDGSDPSCLPIDVFAFNAIDPHNLPYIFSPSNTKSRNKQTVISGSINGDLGEYGIKSPWAEHGIGIALGAEHRRESLVFTADEIAEQGGTRDSDGVISVNEGYGEIEVPILSDLPYAKALTINGGVRYSAYHNEQHSTGFASNFNVLTYKAELSYAPTSDLRLRASYNRAIRAPNISELFGTVSLGNVTATDPCAGANPTLSLEVCERTGVTAAQYGLIPECPAGVCVEQYGGNRNVKPEKGDTYTVGLILTPRALRNFSLSVDYFHIKVKDYISNIDPSLTISQCATTGDPYYCSLFHRDPRSGVLFGNDGYVVATTLNTGYLLTSGLDITSNYSFGIGRYGKIDFDLVGTYLTKLVTEPLPGLGSYDCKGLYGYTCGEPSPKWRHQLRTTWSIPGPNKPTLSLAWRYFGGVRLSSSSDQPAFEGLLPSEINRKIKAYNYFDLATTISFEKKLTLRAGVNNLFDRDPPAIAQGILSTFGNGNTYPGVYDPLGRTIFIGATVEF
ncbi:TonB-dependent receptor [Sphingomonas oligoaromativorans]|uniref:TonB-dependent receptor n=1 Tax=Sphingomonas oligoaromativorans TaxID=575322 RepID=UPI00142432B6|nr:TonB-dependent receptor [Sphingomonas oligoaromativorans]NIJ32146.1 outer membrane receptor protein involved in Fe transport [Sphingomonas oligoaromativorans]